MNDAKLGELLAKIGVLTPQQLYSVREALAATDSDGQKRNRLTHILVNMGFASYEELGRLAAMALRLPYVSLDKVKVPKKLVALLTREEARSAKGVVVKVDGKRFFLATSDPLNMAAFDELQFKLNGRIFPVVTTEEESVRSVGHYYSERIVIDRPFDLPESDTLDYDKPEVYDVKAARAKARKAAQPDPSSVAASPGTKAAQDKLAAAAQTVRKVAPAPAPEPEAAPRRPALRIEDAPVAPPVKAPAPAAPPKAAAEALPEEGMPMIRDADDLAAPIAAAHVEEPADLEVLDLDDADEAIAGEVIEDEAEPAPAAAADDVTSLAALFGAMDASGLSAEPAAAATEDAQELARLFMGALGGPEPDSGSKPAASPAADDLAKELAQLLLGD